VQAALASGLVLTGTFEQILAYFFFVTVAFLALSAGAVFVPWVRGRPVETGAHVPGHRFTPLAIPVLTVLLLVLLASDKPRDSVLGAVVGGARTAGVRARAVLRLAPGCSGSADSRPRGLDCVAGPRQGDEESRPGLLAELQQTCGFLARDLR
jgi:hypothetical protein